MRRRARLDRHRRRLLRPLCAAGRGPDRGLQRLGTRSRRGHAGTLPGDGRNSRDPAQFRFRRHHSGRRRCLGTAAARPWHPVARRRAAAGHPFGSRRLPGDRAGPFRLGQPGRFRPRIPTPVACFWSTARRRPSAASIARKRWRTLWSGSPRAGETLFTPEPSPKTWLAACASSEGRTRSATSPMRAANMSSPSAPAIAAMTSWSAHPMARGSSRSSFSTFWKACRFIPIRCRSNATIWRSRPAAWPMRCASSNRAIRSTARSTSSGISRRTALFPRAGGAEDRPGRHQRRIPSGAAPL